MVGKGKDTTSIKMRYADVLVFNPSQLFVWQIEWPQVKPKVHGTLIKRKAGSLISPRFSIMTLASTIYIGFQDHQDT